jgi:hypothetical protein
MFAHKFLGKRNILRGLFTNDKCFANNHVGASRFIFFFYMGHESLIFPGKFCTDIECLDIHAEFYLKFYYYSEMCFSHNSFISPMSQIDFRLPLYLLWIGGRHKCPKG